MNLDLDNIFTVKKKITRNSKTAGAMREPLRTLNSQANMNKFVALGTSVPKSAVQLAACKKVGDKYECPYCAKSFSATQGVKKAYNRHLSSKACQKKRESLLASDESDGEVDDGALDGDDGDSSNDHDDSSREASLDANDDSTSRPSKKSRK